MYLYRVGYYGWDEGDKQAVYHEKAFSLDEFREMVVTVAVEVAIDRKAEEFPYIHSFSDLYYGNQNGKLLDRLCTRFGFKPVEYQAEFFDCSNYGLFDGDLDDRFDGADKVNHQMLRERLASVGITANPYEESGKE